MKNRCFITGDTHGDLSRILNFVEITLAFC